MLKNERRIEIAELQLGSRFSEPLFFDDGVNMFLASNLPLRQEHLDSLRQWNISHIVTCGRELLLGQEDSRPDGSVLEDIPELEPVD